MTPLQFIYGILKKVFSFFGYFLIIFKKDRANAIPCHELILSGATYAPWLSDERFKATFSAVKNYTLVDKFRCYELWQLVSESKKLTGALIEVGVWRGGSGALIADRAKLCGIEDTIYLCDTFEGVVKTGEKDPSYNGGEHSDASIIDVNELVSKLNLDNVKILTGVFPDETANLITAQTFRLCHIDVDVYRSAKDILDWVWPKLVNGGIVIFDDYGFQTCNGVTTLVNEERNKTDRIVIHNINGHAILIKLQ